MTWRRMKLIEPIDCAAFRGAAKQAIAERKSLVMAPQQEDKLARFLALVPTANWKTPPAVWNEQFRQALSDGLVKIGWGGVIKLIGADGENVPE